MVAMCGIIAMCYLASEASQNPEQQIPIAIELTQDTANIPNAQNSVLCQGKDKIIAAIGKLLVKLMAEETFWNGTVGQAKGQMATIAVLQFAIAVWQNSGRYLERNTSIQTG